MRFLICILLFAAKAKASSINFIPNDLNAARNQARNEAKLVLVKFYADWCLPCKIMDESTWPEENVVKFVNQNCIAVQIDFDKIEAIETRKYFIIERLPTTLLLDACGNEVARLENSVGSAQMLDWLKMFNLSKNKFCEEGNAVALPDTIVSSPETEIFSPNPPQFASDQPAPRPQDAPKPQNDDGLLQNTSPEKKGKWSFLGRKKRKKNRELDLTAGDSRPPRMEKPFEYPASHAYSNPGAVPNSPVFEDKETSNSIFKPSETMLEDAKPKATAPTMPESASEPNHLSWASEKEGFAVQVVACTSEEKAQSVKNQCLATYNKPVALIPPSVSGDRFYRVVVGQFGSKAEADRFKPIVRKSFADAFVKDLSKF